MAKAKHTPPTSTNERDDDGNRPFIAYSVFVEVATGGKRPGQALTPLHEVPLLERKLRALGSEITDIRLQQSQAPRIEGFKGGPTKPEAVIHGHYLADVEDAYRRLVRRYTFLPEGAKEGDEVNLVESVYGNERDGLKALAVTMRRLHSGYHEMMDRLGSQVPGKDELRQLLEDCGPRAALEEEIEDEILRSK